jgi:hypothetical protein
MRISLAPSFPRKQEFILLFREKPQWIDQLALL